MDTAAHPSPHGETGSLCLAGIGVCAPGFASWAEARAVLTGLTAYRDRGLPPLERLRLPRNEARRISLSMRIALEVAEEALAGSAVSRSRLASVFACSGGNTESLHKVLGSLGEKMVSPSQFAQMGHHAAAGSWSILAGSPQPTTSIGAFEGSFAAGLLEAASQASVERRPILLVAHDVPPPPAFRRARRVRTAFGLAMLLAPRYGMALPAGRLHLRLTSDADETPMAETGLEALRTNNPAARALPLLRLIAAGAPGHVVLPYLGALRIEVCFTPC